MKVYLLFLIFIYSCFPGQVRKKAIKIHPLDKYIETIFPVEFSGKGVYCDVYNFGLDKSFSIDYKQNTSFIEMNKWYDCILENGSIGQYYLKLKKIDGLSPEEWPPAGKTSWSGAMQRLAVKNCFIELVPSKSALMHPAASITKDNNLLFNNFLERIKKIGFCETDFIELSKSYSMSENEVKILSNGTYDPFKYDSMRNRGTLFLFFSEDLIPKIGESYEPDLINPNFKKEMLPSRLFTFLCPLRTKVFGKEIIADKKALYQFPYYKTTIDGEEYIDSTKIYVYSFKNKVTAYELCHFLYNKKKSKSIPGKYNKCEKFINYGDELSEEEGSEVKKIGTNTSRVGSPEVEFYKRQRDNPKAVCGWEPPKGESLKVKAEGDKDSKWHPLVYKEKE